MKSRWAFNESDLSLEIERWVQAQKVTGQPKAVNNADFVGKAIVDFLSFATSLKVEPEKDYDLSNTDELIEAFKNMK